MNIKGLSIAHVKSHLQVICYQTLNSFKEDSTEVIVLISILVVEHTDVPEQED